MIVMTAASIEAAMSSLEKNNANGELFVEKELKKIMKYLKEEDRVCKLLEHAVKANKMDQLSAALEEAQRLAKNVCAVCCVLCAVLLL